MKCYNCQKEIHKTSISVPVHHSDDPYEEFCIPCAREAGVDEADIIAASDSLHTREEILQIVEETGIKLT
ncbi:hypothetical protein M0R19_04895 [Candidatus Pacearchaeota archaeon]|jgi:hypothetical protein|nr:hypothetical protein [Candidatus Pacearchaeota archaeon]